MSFLIAAPEMVTAAVSDLAGIESALGAARAAAATRTTTVLAAGEDEVSAAIAAVFSLHGKDFEALNARAAAFQEQFVQTLTSTRAAYTAAEAANASPLAAAVQAAQSLAVFSPVKDLTGRPLIGNGANATAPGGNGGDGGFLIGNGGNGAAGAPGQNGGNGGSAGLWGHGGNGGAGGNALGPALPARWQRWGRRRQWPTRRR